MIHVQVAKKSAHEVVDLNVNELSTCEKWKPHFWLNHMTYRQKFLQYLPVQVFTHNIANEIIKIEYKYRLQMIIVNVKY